MTRIKYLLFSILISLGASEVSYAQQQNSIGQHTLSDRLDNVQFAIKHNRDNSFYAKGSPFINETFEVVKFKKFGDKTFAARYNANLEEMQIKRDNDTIALYNTENFEITFALSNKVYKTHSYTDKMGQSKHGFLVVLKETDSLAVLKEEVIKFYDKKPANNGYDTDKPAEFRRLNDVYYYRLGGEISLLPKKRNDFLKLFPEHSNKIKVFIKKNKISLKEDDDLITLFEYLETL